MGGSSTSIHEDKQAELSCTHYWCILEKYTIFGEKKNPASERNYVFEQESGWFSGMENLDFIELLRWTNYFLCK